jgi:hypothetical protein
MSKKKEDPANKDKSKPIPQSRPRQEKVLSHNKSVPTKPAARKLGVKKP